ncbi:MAG: hypothetical protein FJ291_31400 [Planctomycetes bacterium]|nr:hypothetical protein [Planctomycetota bacterium]
MGTEAMSIALAILANAAEPAYPAASWEKKAPAEVGLDAAKLDAFAKAVGGRGCVTRHGYMAFTWGDAAKRGDVASACKPWFTHFLLKAIEDGKVKSLDDKVRVLEPRLARLNPHLKFKDSLITWRHLATQTSCYGVTEEPGAAFCYNDWQMALFWDLLFLKVYGATYETVDEKVLTASQVLEIVGVPAAGASGALPPNPQDFPLSGRRHPNRKMAALASRRRAGGRMR